MRTHRRLIVLGIFMAVGAFLGTQAASAVGPADQSTDPRFGKWRLKPTDPAAPPSTNVMTYESFNSTGMKITINRLNEDGSLTAQWGYTTMFDGKDEPMTGSRAKDTASVRKVTDRINEITYKRGGRITQILTNVITTDGQAIGIIYMNMDETGKTSRITFATYEKMQ
jgi:hypothetical protein